MIGALVSASRVLMALTARSLGEVDVDVTLSQYRALVVLASRGATHRRPRRRTGRSALDGDPQL